MKYFQSLPTIMNPDYSGNQIVVKNLMTRLSVIPSLLNNSAVYYQYDIQEGDTPEIISYKYYGTPDNFWMVMFANQLLDPQWDWPMNSQVFESYIIDKYGSVSNAQNQIAQYTKTLTTTDNTSQTTTSESIIIDVDEYDNFINVGLVTYNLPNGASVTTSESVSAISSYNYEISQNEAKRSINLINVQYLQTVEDQFTKLVS